MTARALEGTTALVTGSSRNLGAVIARELAGRGARVVLTAHHSVAEAEQVIRDLPGGPRSHLLVTGDLAVSDDARRVAEEALDRAGRVDILVNNAGPFAMDPYVEMSEETWDTVVDVNLRAAYLVSRVLAPGMRTAGWGRIVNVSAGSAYIRNHSVYTLAKAALITLTEELAVELGPEITVNAVAPGQIAESAEDIAEFDPSFVERAIEWTPLRRLVTRPEVAALVAELCGPAFASVTGATIPVDGGWRLPRF